jgi:hypothetical protein
VSSSAATFVEVTDDHALTVDPAPEVDASAVVAYRDEDLLRVENGAGNPALAVDKSRDLHLSGNIEAGGNVVAQGDVQAPRFFGAVDTIVCQKHGVFAGNTGSQSAYFTAEDCGGQLPDEKYTGVGMSVGACGGITNWSVLQPGSGSNPGVNVWLPGGCSTDRAGYSVSVLYIRTKP